MPEILDNDLKEQIEVFLTELGHLTAEQIMKAIPVSHPKTNAHESVPGVSRLPPGTKASFGKAAWKAMQ